jgi:hypothetical protein
MAVLQDVVGPEEDVLVVATMVHLLRYGRCTCGDRTRAQLLAALSETPDTVSRENGRVVRNEEDTDAQGESPW